MEANIYRCYHCLSTLHNIKLIIRFKYHTFGLFLLVSTVVGFMVGGKIKNGMINGAISAVIAGVIVTLIMVAMYILQGYGAYLSYMAYSLVLYLVIEIILGVIGGILGSLVKVETYKYGLKNE